MVSMIDILIAFGIAVLTFLVVIVICCVVINVDGE